MTLEQYAYFAEIIGVILVIASLIYVAQQLRQNNEMARVAAAGLQVQRDFDITESIIVNRELMEVWLKGDSQFDSLDDADKQRLVFFERRAIVWWHHTYQLRKRGLLQDPEWQSQVGIIRAVAGRQAVRESWGIFRDGFEKSFRDFMDEKLMISVAMPPESE